jgi:hypothetical protein
MQEVAIKTEGKTLRLGAFASLLATKEKARLPSNRAFKLLTSKLFYKNKNSSKTLFGKVLFKVILTFRTSHGKQDSLSNHRSKRINISETYYG